jgi:GT2 family glycosyltransferase
MVDVSVIVPVFNSLAHLPAFFESLARALPEGSEVIVVDDASTELIREAIPELPTAREVIYLRNDRNLGNAGAVNRGFQIACGDVVVQLNADLVLDPKCITSMVGLIGASGADVGIVGSKLLYPTSGLTQSVGMAFGLHSKRHVYRHLPPDHPLCTRTREVQIVTGATVAMTRKVIDQIGPLDERLYNHNLDLDHCLRARSQGLRNLMCAESVAYHWRNRSGSIRYARVEAAEAAFWAKWSGRYVTDLGQFVEEAVLETLSAHPSLQTTPFTMVDLSRGADQPLITEAIARWWPDAVERTMSHRQMSNPSEHLWLPVVLPHWAAGAPTPFIYLVDSHQELSENAMWFRARREVVSEELIIDASATVLTSSELCRLSGNLASAAQ